MWRYLKHSCLWLLGILVPLAVVCLVLVVGNDGRVGPFWAKYRQVEIGMSDNQVIAILGPPSDEVRPGGTCGDHFLYWEVPDGRVIVSCDMADVVYDKKAPWETRWEQLQRDLRKSKYEVFISRFLGVSVVVLIFYVPCWLLAWSSRSEPISPAGFRRIRLGMTPSEIETAIGLLASDHFTHKPQDGAISRPVGQPLRSIGIPMNDFINAINGAGSETGESMILAIWRGDAYCIWVAFDERGSVVGAYLLKSESHRDSALTAFLDGIRIRLG